MAKRFKAGTSVCLKSNPKVVGSVKECHNGMVEVSWANHPNRSTSWIEPSMLQNKEKKN